MSGRYSRDYNDRSDDYRPRDNHAPPHFSSSASRNTQPTSRSSTRRRARHYDRPDDDDDSREQSKYRRREDTESEGGPHRSSSSSRYSSRHQNRESSPPPSSSPSRENPPAPVSNAPASEPAQTEVPSCAICLEPIKLRGELDCCRHEFCFDCIFRWSKTANTCPLCKARFRNLAKINLEAPPPEANAQPTPSSRGRGGRGRGRGKRFNDGIERVRIPRRDPNFQRDSILADERAARELMMNDLRRGPARGFGVLPHFPHLPHFLMRFLPLFHDRVEPPRDPSPPPAMPYMHVPAPRPRPAQPGNAPREVIDLVDEPSPAPAPPPAPAPAPAQAPMANLPSAAPVPSLAVVDLTSPSAAPVAPAPLRIRPQFHSVWDDDSDSSSSHSAENVFHYPYSPLPMTPHPVPVGSVLRRSATGASNVIDLTEDNESNTSSGTANPLPVDSQAAPLYETLPPRPSASSNSTLSMAAPVLSSSSSIPASVVPVLPPLPYFTAPRPAVSSGHQPISVDDDSDDVVEVTVLPVQRQQATKV